LANSRYATIREHNGNLVITMENPILFTLYKRYRFLVYENTRTCSLTSKNVGKEEAFQELCRGFGTGK
jgi:hypothetical protein